MASTVFIGLLASQAPKVDVIRLLGLVFVTSMCSSIPILVGYPEPWLMGDVVLCLTILELIVVVLALRPIVSRVASFAAWITSVPGQLD